METQAVRTWNDTSFSAHVYTLRRTYDLVGRRLALHHPGVLVGAADSTRWSYDVTSGNLASMTDLLGRTYTFAFDSVDQLTRMDRPGTVQGRYTYFGDGTIARDSIRNLSTSPVKYTDAVLRNTLFAYDARAHVLSALNGAGRRDSIHTKYAGLGHLVQMADTSRTDIGGIAQTFHGTETFNYDALANQVSMSRVTSNSVWPGNVAGSTSGEQFAYASDSTGRLRKRFSNDESDSLRYNQAGDLEFEYDTQGGMRTSHDRAQFYGADGTLRAVDDRTASALQNNVYTGNAFYTFEEYRYDAFGRRVAMRSRRYCDMGRFEHRLPCLVSVVRRTVWDGDMELDEVQMPGGDASTTAPAATDVVMERDSGSVALVVVDSGGAIPNDPNPFFGRVAYSYGLTLDQPVAVNRYGYLENAAAGDSAHHFAPYTLSPFWSWRGVVEVGLFNDGGAVPYDVTGATSRLARRIYWPYSVTAYHRQFLDQTSWQGSLMDDKQDGTGLAYRRNRYLDPSSGRFTQEDPAGVGGGLNAYGFAGGDPVTYSDPFGLMGCEWGNIQDCKFFEMSASVGTFGMGTSLGSLGKLEFEASPFGTATAKTDLGTQGFSQPTFSVEGGFDVKATGAVGPGKASAKLAGKANPSSGNVSAKLSGSVSVSKASLSSSGSFGMKLGIGSVSVTPSLGNIFTAVTEPLYQWAKPGLDFITGH